MSSLLGLSRKDPVKIWKSLSSASSQAPLSTFRFPGTKVWLLHDGLDMRRIPGDRRILQH